MSKWITFKENAPPVAVVVSSCGVIVTLLIFALSQQRLQDIENKNLDSLKESLKAEISENLYIVTVYKNYTSSNNTIFTSRFSSIVLEEAIKNPNFGNELIGRSYGNSNVDYIKMKVLLRQMNTDIDNTNRELDDLESNRMGDSNFSLKESISENMNVLESLLDQYIANNK